MADIDIVKLVERKLTEYGDQITATLRDKLIAAGKIGTGDLIESIQFKVSEQDGIVTLDIVANEYFQWVDQGIKPGGKQPPPAKMLQWVQTRGLRPKAASGIPESKAGLPRTDRSLAFLIGRKIARDGIPATNVLSSAMNEVQYPLANGLNEVITQAIVDIIAGGLNEIAQQINSDVMTMTVNQF